MIYIILATVFVLLLALELFYFRVAEKYDIVDRTTPRSSHTSVTPRGGGIIFLLGVWLYAAFFGLTYPWFFLAVTLAGVVSFIDDIRSLSVGCRLVVQFVSVFLMFCQFGMPGVQPWWIVVIALVVCVGIVNAYNFMDGINGITGGYSLAVLLPLIYLNNRYGFIDSDFLYVTGLSLIVFCIFNFRRRALCFAGDVGSISIAFILLFALGRLIIATHDLSYLAFLAVYGVDAVLTICHRIKLRENLDQAHRKHAYQLMSNELKVPHILVSTLYMVLQLAVSAGLIFLPVNHYIYLAAVVVILAVAYMIFIKKYYHLHREYLESKKLQDKQEQKENG